MSMLNFDAWENSLAGKFWNADGNQDAWKSWMLSYWGNNPVVVMMKPETLRLKHNGRIEENFCRWYRHRGWPKGWMKHLLKPVAKEA